MTTQTGEYVIDKVNLRASRTKGLGTEDLTAVVNHTAGGLRNGAIPL
ncbi:MAG: hypothetical protein RSD27_11085 [Ruthenibacterium sp.]